MRKKRKHHYIPVGILKNFELDGKLNIYSKSRIKFYASSPNDAFAQRDLNRLKNINGIDEFNGIEDIFDIGYESPVLKIFKRILGSFSTLPPHNKGLTNQDYHFILNFIKISIFRPPHVLNYFISKTEANLYGQLLLNWYVEKGNFEFPDFIKVPDNIKFAFLNDRFKIILSYADIKLCVNVIEIKDKQFLLSDSYINLVTPNDNWLQDEKLEIHFAISPKIMLSFYRANPNVKRTVWHSMNAKEIDSYNSVVIENSHDLIGCSNRDYLLQEIERNKHLLSIKNKYHNIFNWNNFKTEVIREIQRYKSESKIEGEHKIRLHVTDDFKFNMYSEEDFKRLF